MQRSTRSTILCSVLLAVAVLFIWIASRSQIIRANIGNRDSIEYWAAGYLLVHDHNPYDPGEVLSLEKSQGLREARPVMFRSPPWGLALIALLGLLDAFGAWLLWFLTSIVVLVVSVRSCRVLFGLEEALAHDCALVGYLFAPVLVCLEAGQIGIFLLLGVVLFLRWEGTRPFLAGAALLLPFAKPQLFLVFAAALVPWLVYRRRWAMIAGFGASLTMSLVVALWFDPAVFPHYRAMLTQQAIGDEFIPTLAGAFRLLVPQRPFWIQFFPAALSIAWAVWFWTIHRRHWNWREHGLVVLLISVLVSPYAWTTDEVVLLPVVFQAAAWLFAGPLPGKAAVPVYVMVALNAILLVMAVVQVPLPSGAYVWSGLLWAEWHGVARSQRAARVMGQVA